MAVEDTTALAEHFDPAEFDALIADHGTPVLWRRALVCPCQNLNSNAPDVTCPFCQPYSGLLWDDGVPLVLLAPGRNRRDVFDEAGMFMQGMVWITFPSTVTPGHLDQVVFAVAELTVNNERHIRGDTDKLGRPTERLRMPIVLSVDWVAAIVGGDLARFVEGTDFTLGLDGSVLWVDAGHGPPTGVQYTVRYRARPHYVIWSPQSRDEHATKQPYKTMAQRLDFFRQPAVGAS